MKRGIFLSIKPEFIKKIISGEKNYEFRKYCPKEEIDLLYVYETSPSCLLKYIITIDKIIKYPNEIDEYGYGNEDFNKGLKKSKFAYHISKVEKLESLIPLSILKKDFNFTAPQSYAYDSCYPKLVKKIENSKKRVLINNII